MTRRMWLGYLHNFAKNNKYPMLITDWMKTTYFCFGFASIEFDRNGWELLLSDVSFHIMGFGSFVVDKNDLKNVP